MVHSSLRLLRCCFSGRWVCDDDDDDDDDDRADATRWYGNLTLLLSLDMKL